MKNFKIGDTVYYFNEPDCEDQRPEIIKSKIRDKSVFTYTGEYSNEKIWELDNNDHVSEIALFENFEECKKDLIKNYREVENKIKKSILYLENLKEENI